MREKKNISHISRIWLYSQHQLLIFMGYKFHTSWEDRPLEWQHGVVEQVVMWKPGNVVLVSTVPLHWVILSSSVFLDLSLLLWKTEVQVWVKIVQMEDCFCKQNWGAKWNAWFILRVLGGSQSWIPLVLCRYTIPELSEVHRSKSHRSSSKVVYFLK